MRYYILLVVALILGILYLPFGFLYTILGYRFTKVKQDNILLGCSITIDIQGNILGLPFYHLFAINNDGITLFCRRGITISASIGHLIKINNLNLTGQIFSRFLDWRFKEKNHCLNAYYQLNLN